MEVSKECQKFCKEAFNYLLDYFEVVPAPQKTFEVFTEEMGHAILAIGYIWRRRWRTLFDDSGINWDDIFKILEFAKEFKPTKDACYFFRLLMWISQIFELTFRYTGIMNNYIEAAGRDIREETSKGETSKRKTSKGKTAKDETSKEKKEESYFKANGGYKRLQETACFINKIYEVLQPVIKEEDPRNKKLKCFVEAVECLENPSDRSLTDQLIKLISLKKSVLAHARAINPSDEPFLIIMKYMMCLRYQSTYFVQNGKLCGHREQAPPSEAEQREICDLFGELLRRFFPKLDDTYGVSCEKLLINQSAACRHLTDVSTETDTSHTSRNRLYAAYNPVNWLFYKVPEADIQKILEKGEESTEKSLPREDSRAGSDEPFKRVLNSNIRENRIFKVYEEKKKESEGVVITYAVFTEQCSFDRKTSVVIFKDDA